jgi:hypothetical protein
LSDDPWDLSLKLAGAVLNYADPELREEYYVARRSAGGRRLRYVSGFVAGRQSSDRAQAANRRVLVRDRAWKKLCDELRFNLSTGELVARGLREPLSPDSIPETIPAHLWDALRMDIRASSASGGGLRYTAIHVLPRAKLAGLTTTPSSPTARAERESTSWIRRHAEAGTAFASKAAAFEAASREIARLSRRSFDRAWKAHAPADWKRPGRPSGKS